MSGEQDLAAATESAWRRFRQRLADRIAAMGDGDVLVISYGTDVVDLVAGDGWVWLMEERHEQRQADRVAVLVVAHLRDDVAALHPAFLDADGLEVDPETPVPRAEAAPDPELDDAPHQLVEEVAVPRDHDDLQELVDQALREVFPDLRKDPDGDIPVRAGQSIAFVRVCDDRPAVEVFAEVVVEPEDLDRLAVELNLLNDEHPLWQFCRRDETVLMRHVLPAVPFSGFQLRDVLHQFLDDVDRVAAALVARVGGRRFFDPNPKPPAAVPTLPATPDEDLALPSLLELLHLDRLRVADVAGLFDHDRGRLIRTIQALRAGHLDPGDHELDLVLTWLRLALRHTSDGCPEREPRRPVPPRPRSVQESLLPEADLDDDALDLGWSA